MESNTQEAILDLVRRDDPAALERIYDALGERLHHYLAGLVGSRTASEDILQDLFVRLAKNRRRLLGMVNLSGYLFAMARNLAMDHLRRRPLSDVDILDYQDFLVADTPAPSETDEQEAVLKAVAALPAKQRDVVALKCFQGLTFAEVADALNVSLNTAASRYRYALDKLRNSLAAMTPEA